MEGIFILGNNKSFEELDGTFVLVPNLINEIEINDWVIKLFKDNEINKIIIEIGAKPLLALQIGYHIRLSLEIIREKVLIPIMFISNISLNRIIIETEVYSQILATKGIAFSEFNLSVNRVEIENLDSLNESEYLTKFLKIINIQPDEAVGRHSLANIWGAYAMDRASNANVLSQEDFEFKKKLYFKYVYAFNNLDKLKPQILRVFANVNLGNVKRIDSQGKKILFIDDEAANGWEMVMREIFRVDSTDDFVVINEKVKDFQNFSGESKRIIESQEFDLYLIDLRLNGLEEDNGIDTENFSGMHVLKKIKSLNQGNQVILFTASNKVWNLKALFKAGAENYYLKESPEYNFSKSISEQNYEDFRNNVYKCFERSFLKEIFIEWEDAKSKNTTLNHDFIAESDKALDIAWELIQGEQLDLGFLILFQSIESIANKLYTNGDHEDTLEGQQTICKADSENYEWIMKFNKDSINGDYFSSSTNTQSSYYKATTLYKISCFFKIKYNKNDIFLKYIGLLNSKRNEIAHGGIVNVVTKDNLIEILKIISEIRNS